MKFKTIPLFIALLISGCGPVSSSSSEQDSTSEQPVTSSEPSTSFNDSSNNTSLPSEVSTSDNPTNLVSIDVYALNDMHGAITDKNGNAGIAKTSTYLKNAKATNPNTLILSSGDMWQGSSESNNTKGQLMTDWMNDVGFASMTLGNHEFDWSDSYIKANQEQAEFPFLAINIFDNTTNERVTYAEPSTIVTIGGVKVGIIGAIGQYKGSILPTWVENVDFIDGFQLTNLIKAESLKLKSEGADIIIYSVHDGGSSSNYRYPSFAKQSDFDIRPLTNYYDDSLSNGYVDLVFEAHTHQRYSYVDTYGVYHLQGGSYGEALSHVNLTYNFELDDISINIADHIYTNTFMNLANDAYALSLFTKYQAQIGDIYSTIGYNAQLRTSSYLRQVAADLYINKGLEVWGEEYDIVLGGGFFSLRSPYNLVAGDVNISMIQELFPFENNLELVSIRGSDLLDKFINSSNSNYAVSFSSYGSSISSTINRSQIYYIIVDQYTSTYAPNNLTVVASMNPKTFAYQLIVDYVKSGALA